MELKYLDKKIVSNRLYLQKHTIKLASTMFEHVQKDRERLFKFLPWVPYINSVQDEEDYIKSTMEDWEKGTLFDFGIFLNDSNTYIGNIGVHSINWKYERAEIGYWLLGDFEGNGYMTEAVKILQGHLFEVGFHRVQIRCSDLNMRSEEIPKRLGYVFEGIAREDSIEHGVYRNTKTFSKLSTD